MQAIAVAASREAAIALIEEPQFVASGRIVGKVRYRLIGPPVNSPDQPRVFVTEVEEVE